MLQGLIDMCVGLLEWLIGLIPRITFFEGFTSAVSSIYGVLYEASVIIPFSDLFICIGVISGFYVTLFQVYQLDCSPHTDFELKKRQRKKRLHACVQAAALFWRGYEN